MRVWGNLVVDVDYTFNGVQAIMRRNSQITVNAGVRLTVVGGEYRGCDRLWRGFNIAGEMHMTGACTVRDAQQALVFQHQSFAHIVGNTFLNNHDGIVVAGASGQPDIFVRGDLLIPDPSNPTGPPINSGLPQIADNSFVGTGSLLPNVDGQPIGDGLARYGVWLRRVAFFVVGFDNLASNSFEGLRQAVRADNANAALVSNAVVQNVGRDQYPAIEVSNSDPFVMRLLRMTTGIFTGVEVVNTQSAVANSNITATQYGIHDRGSVNKRFVVTACEVDAHIAIWAENKAISGSLPDPTQENVQIEGNLINAPDNETSPLRLEGVLLTNNTAPTWVHDNDISDYRFNIHIINCAGSGGVVEGNYVHNEWRQIHAGLFIENTRTYQFVDNQVETTFQSTTGNDGFNVAASPQNLYCCNSIDGQARSVFFTGICSNTKLRNTQFLQGFTGLMIQNGQISQQLNPGNSWPAGSWPTGYSTDAFFGGTALQLTSSLVYSDINLVPAGNAKIVVNGTPGNPGNWFNWQSGDPDCINIRPQNPGEGNYCGETPFNIHPFNLIDFWDEFTVPTEEELQAAMPPEGGDAITLGLKWSEQQYLFRKMSNQPSLGAQSPTLQAFYEDAQTNSIGQFFELGGQMEAIFLPSGDALEEWASLQDGIKVKEDSIALLENQMGSADADDLEALSDSRDALRAGIATLNLQLEDLMNAVNDARYVAAQALALENQNIAAEAIFELNEQQYNEVYLATVAQDNFELSTEQQDVVNEIAGQCPLAGGNAVFKARALQRLYAHVVYDDEELCGAVPRSAAANAAVQSRPVLSPNPAREIVQLPRLERCDASQEMTVEVFNALGKRVRSRTVPNGASVLVVADLPAGTYFLVLRADGCSARTFHFVKI